MSSMHAGVQPNNSQAIWTIGQIVRKCNEPMHRVEYTIKSRNIQPIAKAGNARVFNGAAVEQIIEALLAMNSRRDSASDKSKPRREGAVQVGGA